MIVRHALEDQTASGSGLVEDDEVLKKSDKWKKVETRVDIRLTASPNIGVEEDDREEESEVTGSQAAGRSISKGNKRIASQARTSGRQRKPRRLD